jgi:16S rRNA (guanine527-N7)-methyltransferase
VKHGGARSLAALVGAHGLGERQAGQLTVVLDRLAADDTAPTSVRDPAQAVGVHLADSLTALDLAAVRQAGTIVDIGAGAGFPGLPLAVALPDSRVTLVDSQARKCAFMQALAGEVGLANLAVVCARVEEWPEGIGAHDVALARALAPAPVVLEYAAPLLRLGGTLVDWRGRRDEEEEAAALAAARELGLERVEVRSTSPFAGARAHHLHVYGKVAETPSRFPRRAGMARKRPLG